MTRYFCTNCDHRFESKPAERLECPNCCWTTSVIEDVFGSKEVSSSDAPAKKAVSKKRETKPKKPFPVKRFLSWVLGGILIPAIIYILLQQAPEIIERINQSTTKSVEIEIPEKSFEEQEAEALEAFKEAPVPTITDLITQDEMNILHGQVNLDMKALLDESEKKIMDRRVNLKTGLVEDLPSAVWTMEQFKGMLKEQEGFYKVPLPRGYRRRLIKHVEEYYLKGNQLFEVGDLLGARNAWVRALAVPVYEGDLQKHRGVVLTMIRPFINDTLSKIGAINRILSERQIRDQEYELSQQYKTLSAAIDAKKWKESLTLIAKIESLAMNLDQKAAKKIAPPDYPDLRTMDRDIGYALIDLTSPENLTVVDMKPLLNDIRAKKQVVERLLPEKIEQSMASYQKSLEFIHDQEWVNAKQNLSQVNSPKKLADDARQKIAIIDKLLDSADISG